MNVESNGELEKQLAELVKLGKDGAIKAADFVIAQAPELVEQMLRWHFVKSIAACGACLLLAVVALTIGLLMWRHWSKLPGGAEPVVMFTAFAFIGGVCGICSNMEWLQIWVAPKLYVFEWCTQILK
jgi:hypothetical protein